MLNFIHDIPTKIYFGQGQITRLPSILERFGKRVLLTYGGGSIKKIGLYDTVMHLLGGAGFEVFELGGIDPNPRIESVEKGVAICKEKKIDVVLAVGGGSTIDCSKAIAAGVYFEGDDLWDMVLRPQENRRALPLVDVLTLSATGSEYDGGGVISNLKTNEKIGASFTFPYASICDPTYTYSVSAYQTAAGSADIMSHIIEGYFSRTEDSNLADGIAETVLRSVIENLPIALKHPDSYTARANLMMDSSIACSGVPEYGKAGTGWPCHAMEHELSAYYDITHGVGLAILTPRWMRFIMTKDPTTVPRFARFAEKVFGLKNEDEAALARAGVDALERFFRHSGIPMTLSDLKIGTEHFEEMARHADRNGRLSGAYVPLTTEDVVNIYRLCL